MQTLSLILRACRSHAAHAQVDAGGDSEDQDDEDNEDDEDEHGLSLEQHRKISTKAGIKY